MIEKKAQRVTNPSKETQPHHYSTQPKNKPQTPHIIDTTTAQQIKVKPSSRQGSQKLNSIANANGSQQHEQSCLSLTSNTRRHKMPEIILKYIIEQARERKNQQQEQDSKKNNFQKTAEKLKRTRTKLATTKSKCQICAMEVPEKEMMSMAKCEHKYCASCLHQYIIYKITSFGPVECPNQTCLQKLDQSSKLYAQLPLKAREKYKKYKQYAQTLKNPNLKLCPDENCEGFLQKQQPKQGMIIIANPRCSTCKKVYCSQCLFVEHEGQCDPFQLSFFQDTLHYRQCSKCKNIIQKSSGCNHMTCRCKYQFCYVCGARWSNTHACANANGQPVNIEPRCGCCCTIPNCQCCYQCCNQWEDCCDGCCDSLCDNCCQPLMDCCESYLCCGQCGGCNCENSCFCQCFLRVLFVMFWITIILPAFAVMLIFMTILRLLIGIVLGIFGIPCLIAENDIDFEWWHVVIAILLLPITLLFFIYLGLKLMFDETGIEHLRELACLPIELMQGICQ